MLLLALSVLWVVLVGALLARAIVQYSAYQQVDRAAPDDLSNLPSITVIVPARNEERNVRECLNALLAQDYPSDKLKIVLVDDGSTDATGDIAAELAKQHTSISVLQGGALPPGCKGKPFACWQGSRAATEDAAPEWFCFIDCDTRAQPRLLRTAVTYAESSPTDLLSLEPFQELGTFWERVLIPAGFLLLAYSQDLRRVNNPQLPDAAINGQFILVRRRVYDAVGGHLATCAEICEDTALARLVKSAGFRISVVGAESLLRTRMYHGLSELWEGVSKNLVEMVGSVQRLITFASIGILLAVAAIALPIWAWCSVAYDPSSAAAWIAALCASAGAITLFAVHIGAARHLRIPPWYGLLFPLGYIMGAPLTAYTLHTRWNHQIVWKGRVYTQPHAEV